MTALFVIETVLKRLNFLVRSLTIPDYQFWFVAYADFFCNKTFTHLDTPKYRMHLKVHTDENIDPDVKH